MTNRPREMTIQEAVDYLSSEMDRIGQFALKLQSFAAIMGANLAAPLIREGLLDREALIGGFERLSEKGVIENSAADQFVQLLMLTRPWGVIEGGKRDSDDDGPAAA